MIENYKKLNNGVIQQINVNKINYNHNYINIYNTYGEKALRMSYLRFGYIIGSIGRIPYNILDIGYGNGDFLKVCSSMCKCYGNDISNYQLPKNVEFVEDIFKNEYDVITFFDSLEHFEDIDFIKDLKCNYIVISLPWCHYYNDDWFKNWKHRKENEHLYHFNLKSLTNFMKENNFKLVNSSNIEDSIRKNKQTEENILTACFKKIINI